MPDKDFLENAPLYKKVSIQPVLDLTKLPTPAIHMSCPECGDDQTFTMINRFLGDGTGVPDTGEFGMFTGPIDRATLRSVYICQGCSEFRRYFLLHFEEKVNPSNHSSPEHEKNATRKSRDLSKPVLRNPLSGTLPDELYVTKVGQFPQVSVKIDKDVDKALGTDLSKVYKKGILNESNSFGIGAFAYYRRIVEVKIDYLLEELGKLAQKHNTGQEFQDAIKKTKAQIVAEKKIELVKDLLPDPIRIGGTNPLKILHQALSEGIHANSDEECLEFAGSIRTLLEVTFRHLETNRKDEIELKNVVKSIAQRNSKKKP